MGRSTQKSLLMKILIISHLFQRIQARVSASNVYLVIKLRRVLPGSSLYTVFATDAKIESKCSLDEDISKYLRYENKPVSLDFYIVAYAFFHHCFVQ